MSTYGKTTREEKDEPRSEDCQKEDSSSKFEEKIPDPVTSGQLRTYP